MKPKVIMRDTPWGPLRADASELYRLLGVRPGALPAEGLPERTIQGIRVYVRPLPEKTGQRRNWDGLRVMAVCACGRHLPVGRLHQHKCKAQPTAEQKPAACPECGADLISEPHGTFCATFGCGWQEGE